MILFVVEVFRSLFNVVFEQLERRREEDELKQIKEQEEHFERVKVFYMLLCIN